MKNNFWRKNFFIIILFLKKNGEITGFILFSYAIWRRKQHKKRYLAKKKDVIKLFDEYKKMMLEKKAKKKVSFSLK